MTAIVGLVAEGKVYIGADSAAVEGWELSTRAEPKVFFLRASPAFLLGITTSFRMGNLLRYRFMPPKHTPDLSTHEYLSMAFMDAVRDCLKAGGFAVKDKEQESGGAFLLGYRGNLYTIGTDYQVGISITGFDALGCGAQIALGALYATEGDREKSPSERVRLALLAAERFSAGVRGPFGVEVL